MDRNDELEQYIDNFNEISLEADNLINNNNYDSIQFYGVLLCYLNYYDNDNFIKIFQKLLAEKCEVLYEILLIYFCHFLNPINQDLDFYVPFIEYCISKKEFYSLERGLSYIKDLETFLTVINKTKESIVDKYITNNNSFKPFILRGNLEIIKKRRNEEFENIITEIRSINYYSKQKKVLLVYFTNIFWIKLFHNYNTPEDINIINCYDIRKICFEYNDLVNELYKYEKNSEIKKDINKFIERDDLAFILDKNIKKLFDKNELSNSEKMGIIEEFNPYYKEDKYSDKRDAHIFDYINLDDNSEEFIDTFRHLQFERMFKDNIIEFLNVLVSKIKNISNFGTILELIDIRKISKADEYFALLKDKYKKIIKTQIESLTDGELYIAVMILAKFVDLIYFHEKNCDFIKQEIDKLDKKISSLIYNELIRRCRGDEYNEMKKFIYQKFLNKLENFNDIIAFIYSLDKYDKEVFMKELMEQCQFTKEEYYSNNDNKKIDLLYELNKKEILRDVEECNYFCNIEKTIQSIYCDLDGKIPIKKLVDFLENEEKQVIKRLGLINILYSDFDPETVYENLKRNIENMH
jgi:hypothetical protein